MKSPALAGLVAAGMAVANCCAASVPDRPYDVCNYVLDHYHNGRLDDGVRVDKGQLLAVDGSKMTFTVSSRGTAQEPEITSADGNVKAQNFYPPRSWPAAIDIIPYEGHFYLLYSLEEGLNSVVEPNGGLICIYKKTMSPVMLTNRLPDLCQKLSDGGLVELKPATVEPDTVSMDRRFFHVGQNRVTGRYHLAPEGQDLIAFRAYGTAGAGCTFEGVAYASQDKVENSARNEALYDVAGDVNNCRNAKMRPFRSGGGLYFLVSGIMPQKPGIEVSQVLQFEKDELKEICRIEKLPYYVPFP